MPEPIEALLQGFCFRLDCPLVLVRDSTSYGEGHDRRHSADDGHSRHHHTGGDETTGRRHRDVVAIADCRHGGERPPQRVTPRVHRAAGPLTLDEP